MQSDLQILEEKFKDIKARLRVAISIIEEAERVFSRVRLEASKLSEEKSSFLGFVKNEIKPDKLVKSKVEFSYDAAKRLLGKQAITVNAFCERERPSHIMIMSVDNKQTGWTEFDVAVSELPKGSQLLNNILTFLCFSTFLRVN